MESLFFLIPLAIILCGFGLRALFWAIDHHQFDDLDSAAHSILFDEEHSSDIDAPDKPETISQKKP
jgi:cbb3-type cytochrome oxidase maturation protein